MTPEQKQELARKLEWPWWANYWTVDKDGIAYFHEERPQLFGEAWNSGLTVLRSHPLERLNINNWQDSLIERPREKLSRIPTGGESGNIVSTKAAIDEVAQMQTEHPNLRDQFAMAALTGMLAYSRNGHGYKPRDKEQHWHQAISEEAYQIADAMINERKKG